MAVQVTDRGAESWSRRDGPLSWEEVGLERLLEAIAPYWPDANRCRERLRRFPGQREFMKRMLAHRCETLGLDPRDAFHPHPSLESLGTDGLMVGKVLSGAASFFYGLEELPTGVLLLGSPKAGKTTAVCHLVDEAQRQGIGVLIPDLRGDYRKLAARLPGAYFIPSGADLFNPLEPPSRLELRKWWHVVSARLTWDLGLQLASQAFAIGLFAKLADGAEQAGVVPTLLDFYNLLMAHKTKPRSSEEGYWERIVARIRALIEVCGEKIFAVQKGFPIIDALEDGKIVILEMRQDRFVADFLTSMRLYYLYYKRLHSSDPFNQKTVLVVLDEQRSLIRAQPQEAGIPDIELLFSRSRALGLGFLVAEQIPSAVSSAVLTSTRLRLAFNTSAPELWFVAKLLGLNQEQAGELVKLPPGQCIARLAGERIPGPFRMTIPLSDCVGGSGGEGAKQELRDVAERSLRELGRSVVPRSTAVDFVALGGAPPAGSAAGSGGAIGREREQAGTAKEELDVLQHLVENPFLTTTQRAEAKRLSAWKLDSLRKRLERQGLIEVVPINPGGRGANFKLWDLTEKGRVLLIQYKVKIPAGFGRGRIEHKWWARTIAAWAKDVLGVEVRVECSRLGKAVDIEIRGDGIAMAIEVACTTAEANHGEQEIKNAREDLEAGYGQVVVLCRDPDAASQLEKRVREELGPAAERVRVGELKNYESAVRQGWLDARARGGAGRPEEGTGPAAGPADLWEQGR